MAHSFLLPGQVQYREIEAQLLRYEYDPQRASQLIEGLGYGREADPSTSSAQAFRGQTGEQVQVEIRSDPTDSSANAAASIADYWQRVGIRATAVRLTPAQDPEVRATAPGFSVRGQAKDVGGLWGLHSSRAALPKNSFRAPAPGNFSRYMNAELDGLVEAYIRTLPVPERISVLGRIIRHVAEQLPVMGIYYRGRPDAFANRLSNVSPRSTGLTGTNPAWNAHEWDIKS